MKVIIKGDADRWQAFCCDYDIAVEGESMAAVAAKLQEAIESYLDVVSALPAGERAGLLNRRTPLLERIRLALT